MDWVPGEDLDRQGTLDEPADTRVFERCAGLRAAKDRAINPRAPAAVHSE